MRKALVILTLATSLAAGRATLLDPLWGLLSSIWDASSLDIGCRADPNGTCNPQPASDIGCGFDPDGCPKGS
jgi:hypothetical protein